MLFMSPDQAAIGVVNLAPPYIQYFDFEGSSLSSVGVTLSETAALVMLNRAEPIDGGYVAEGLLNTPAFTQVRYLSVFDETCGEVVRLTTQKVAEAGQTFMDELLLNRPRWVVDSAGVIYVSDEFDAYSIDVLGAEGTAQRTIGRDYEHLPRSDEEIDNLKRLEGKFNQGAASARMKLSRPRYHRDIEDLHLLENGRLLVLTSRGARGPDGEGWMGTFDVYTGGSAPRSRSESSARVTRCTTRISFWAAISSWSPMPSPPSATVTASCRETCRTCRSSVTTSPS
jgi:hypothetical protein